MENHFYHAQAVPLAFQGNFCCKGMKRLNINVYFKYHPLSLRSSGMLGVVGWWFITDVSRKRTRSHLQGTNRSWTAWALKTGLVRLSPNVGNEPPTYAQNSEGLTYTAAEP